MKYDRAVRDAVVEQYFATDKPSPLGLSKEYEVPTSIVTWWVLEEKRKRGIVPRRYQRKDPVVSAVADPFKKGDLITITKCVQHGASHNGQTGRYLGKDHRGLYKVRLWDKSTCHAAAVTNVGNEEEWRLVEQKKQRNLAEIAERSHVTVESGQAVRLKTEHYDVHATLFKDGRRVIAPALTRLFTDKDEYTTDEIREAYLILREIIEHSNAL